MKIGSSLLITAGQAGASGAWLSSLGDDVASLRHRGKQMIIVSSGAVALGRARIGVNRTSRLDLKQAAAAVGQPILMQAWEKATARHGLAIAQLLLTLDDTESRRRWINARATLETLLSRGILPIINENDSVGTEELRYGDNDRLSARVAQMVRSDLLILLSDVDGLFTRDPLKGKAEHIAFVDGITSEIEDLADGARSMGPGSGGMRSKIAAARTAGGFGCATIIASGRDCHPLRRIAEGGRTTLIAARGSPASAYKQWIAGTLDPAGALHVDPGAVEALMAGKSLLPAGVNAADGAFERGACLRILAPDGREIARGLTSYPSAEVAAIRGLASARIAERLGYRGPDEIVHRNDLVLL